MTIPEYMKSLSEEELENMTIEKISKEGVRGPCDNISVNEY